MIKFGVHVSVAGGIEKAPQRAAEAGCDCFQLFVSNPRSWSLPTVDIEQAALFRRERERCGLGPVTVHMTYLINLAAVDPGQHRRAVEHFRAQYAAARLIGADFFVLHPGSHKDHTLAAGIELVAKSLREAAAEIPDGPVFLLENTAGGGCTIGRIPQELGDIIRQSKLQPERCGVCFDTCHAWATGIDLQPQKAFAKVIAEYDGAVFPGCIHLLHCNDSLFPCGKGKDRHWHIGMGHIGEEGMRNILRTPATADMPVILETPITEECDDAGNLAAARAAAGISHQR